MKLNHIKKYHQSGQLGRVAAASFDILDFISKSIKEKLGVNFIPLDTNTFELSERDKFRLGDIKLKISYSEPRKRFILEVGSYLIKEDATIQDIIFIVENSIREHQLKLRNESVIRERVKNLDLQISEINKQKKNLVNWSFNKNFFDVNMALNIDEFEKVIDALKNT